MKFLVKHDGFHLLSDDTNKQSDNIKFERAGKEFIVTSNNNTVSVCSTYEQVEQIIENQIKK